MADHLINPRRSPGRPLDKGWLLHRQLTKVTRRLCNSKTQPGNLRESCCPGIHALLSESVHIASSTGLPTLADSLRVHNSKNTLVSCVVKSHPCWALRLISPHAALLRVRTLGPGRVVPVGLGEAQGFCSWSVALRMLMRSDRPARAHPCEHPKLWTGSCRDRTFK